MSSKTVQELEARVKELEQMLARDHEHGEALMADDRKVIFGLREEIRRLQNELDQCRKQLKKP